MGHFTLQLVARPQGCIIVNGMAGGHAMVTTRDGAARECMVCGLNEGQIKALDQLKRAIKDAVGSFGSTITITAAKEVRKGDPVFTTKVTHKRAKP
jgi:hypothetical protein